MSLLPDTGEILRRIESDWNTVRAHAEWTDVQIDVVQAVDGDERRSDQSEDRCQQSHFLSSEKLTYDQDEKWEEIKVSHVL